VWGGGGKSTSRKREAGGGFGANASRRRTKIFNGKPSFLGRNIKAGKENKQKEGGSYHPGLKDWIKERLVEKRTPRGAKRGGEGILTRGAEYRAAHLYRRKNVGCVNSKMTVKWGGPEEGKWGLTGE